MAAWIGVHAFVIFAFAAIAFGAGRHFIPRCSPLLLIASATAFGIALVSHTLFILATAGALTRMAVFVTLAITAVLACIPLRRGESLRDARRPLFAILGASTPSFLLALYPPVGFDATMYHLPFARLFAGAGSLVFADTLRFPVFPQLGEMPFSGALLVSDDATAQLTQWLAFLVTTIALFALAEELADRRAAMLAVALWIGTPLALYLAGNAYIDCSLTMYVTLAFAAWHRSTREPRDWRWALLAGAFAGCAAATKYHGLFFLPVLFVAFAWRNRRAAFAFALIAAVFAAPWYVRIARETGNPVFPYASAIFGRHEWQTALDARLESTAANPLNAITDASPIITIAQRAVLQPIAIGAAPHNPWLLLLFPFALATAVADRRQRLPVFASFVYAAIVWTLDWRFLVVVLPMLAIAIGYALSRVMRSVIAASILLAAPGLCWMLLLLRGFGPIPVRAEARDAFLSRRIAVYDSLHHLAKTQPAAVVYMLHAENATYYCPARCMGESYGPYRAQLVVPLLDQPALLAAKLRGFGVEVLVLNRTVSQDAAAAARLERSGFRMLFRSERSEALVVPPG